MRFPFPFLDGVTIRLFEPVETVDTQYDIVDTGIEFEDGSIDSLVIGGSFATLRKAVIDKETRTVKTAASKEDAEIAIEQSIRNEDYEGDLVTIDPEFEKMPVVV